MMVLDNISYRCRQCGKVYKTWERLVKHKKVTGHLGVDVIEN